MKNKLKKILCLVLVTASVFSLTACGNTKGTLDESAAARAVGEGDGYTYIDDDAIALAGAISRNDETLAQIARDSFDQANAQRTAAGLPALVWSDALVDAACVRATECEALFSHTRPDGSDWWTVNSSIMYGENLAKGFSNAAGAVKGWMNSPTHRANLMDGGFRTMGIAVWRDDSGTLYWAQEFGY